MKSGIKILFLVLSLMLITLMIATLGDFLKMRFNSIWEGSIVELQEGWTLSVDDVVIDSQFTLPNLIKNEDLTGKHVVLTNTIPDTGAPLSSLLMRTSQKTVSISIDGEKIYTQDGNIGNRKIKLPGYINHFAWLKPNIGGKTLTIESVAYSPKTSGQFYEVYLGTRVGQISLLFRYDGVSLIVGVIILICSFIVLLSSPIFLRKLQVYHGALAFAGIELCVGLWVCGGTMSTQLIIHNQLILLFFGIFALFMLPVFLTWFVISMYQIPLASLFSKVVVLFPLTFIGVSFFSTIGDCYLLYNSYTGSYCIVVISFSPQWSHLASL